MKKLTSFTDTDPIKIKLPSVPGCEKTQSTLNENESVIIDNDSISENKEESTDIKNASTYNRYEAMEAPFQDQYESLARPFIYLKKIYENKDTHIGRVLGNINQNISSNVMAENLAQQTQFMILQHVRVRDLRIHIRDNIVTSATSHMASIYLNIINLFIQDSGDSIDKDIAELFALIIETTYRLQDSITFNSFDVIDLEHIRKVIRGLRTYVIKLRNSE